MQESDSISSSGSTGSSGSDDLQVGELCASRCGPLDTNKDPELDELFGDLDEALVVSMAIVEHCKWDNLARLRCGRATTKNLNVLAAEPNSTWSRCKVCFRVLCFRGLCLCLQRGPEVTCRLNRTLPVLLGGGFLSKVPLRTGRKRGVAQPLWFPVEVQSLPLSD